MATNDPFGDFRRRRSSLFDEFLSEFFDRPFGIEGATGPTGTRTSAPLARRPVEWCVSGPVSHRAKCVA